MGVTVSEKLISPHVVAGTTPSAEVMFTAQCDHLDDSIYETVYAAVLAASDAEYDVFGGGILYIPRENVDLRPVGWLLWEATVSYGVVQTTNDSSFSFDTTGGQTQVFTSLDTVQSYPEGDAPDCKGSIGSTETGVEGTEKIVPAFRYQETHYLSDSEVSYTYMETLTNMTGTVNDDTFRAFAAGSCLFFGASGTKRGYGDWEVTFTFLCSRNATNLAVGPDFTGIEKKGWEYLWVRYNEEEIVHGDDKFTIMVPKHVYVEQIYETTDFADLEIGTT